MEIKDCDQKDCVYSGGVQGEETHEAEVMEGTIYKNIKLDSEEDLKNLSKEILLQAAINFYSKNNPSAKYFIEIGFKIAQEDGWMQVAPAWVKALSD